MKYLFYTLIYSIGFLNLSAQNCLPDSTLMDSAAAVYPRPISPDYPNAGINKKACINKPYEFTFTIVIPDSIIIPLSATPVPLEKALIDTIGAISNLPKGIGYSCNPPDCIYKKNTFGCMILKGTPDNTNAPGDYKPVIKLKATVIYLGFPIDLNIEFPGTFFPGEYILTVLSETDCVLGIAEQNIKSNFWFPNPSQGILYAQSTKVENVKIYKLNGELIYSEKDHYKNNLDLSTMDLEGIHFIHWIEDNKAFVQKIIIAK